MAPHFRRFDIFCGGIGSETFGDFLKRNQTFLASNNDDPASPDVVSGLTFDPVGIYLTIDVSSSALLWRKHFR